MLVPYSWLKEFIIIKEPADRVGEKLSRATIGVEEVRKEGKEYVLDLEVTYNRGDLLSVVGVARELAALYRLDLHDEQKPFVPPSGSGKLSVKANKKLSPYYTLTQVNALKYRGTPKEMALRLELAGIRSLDSLVDITNYVMVEHGQPLHAFDADKVRGRDGTMAIEVRNAKRGEKITTIDGSTHNLSTSDIVITDRKGPIAIAGVMGGKATEVGPETKEILLEAAIFDPIAVRKTARRLGLRSEASNRFEHYLSPKNLLKALSSAVDLYQLHGKGKVVGFGEMGKDETTAEPVNLSREKLNRLVGDEIRIGEAREILERLGFKTMSADKGLLAWPPYWRGDIEMEEDLVEEIVRMRGYDQLPAKPLTSASSAIFPSDFEYFRQLWPQLMAGAGFYEAKSYPFLSSQTLTHYPKKEKLLKIKNPISAETEYLKDSDILNLVELAQNNQCSDGRLFELEKIYPQKGEYLAAAAVIWGVKEPFRAIKGVLEALLDKSGVDVAFSPAKHEFLHPKKAARIVIGKTEIGIVGELHPHLGKSYQLNGVAVFELDFEKLFGHLKRWRIFTPISKYPEVYEDFSFYLPYQEALGSLIRGIESADPLIREVSLNDIFERGGKRSVTLRITFQSDTGELSSKDLKPAREKILKLIGKAGGDPRL